MDQSRDAVAQGLLGLRARRWAVGVAWAMVICAATGAGTALLGWMFDQPRWADWLGDGVAIQPNTALCAALAGVSLICILSGLMRWAMGFSIVMILIAVLTFFEHLSGVDLHIDQPLMFGRTWGARLTLAPGRMGFPAITSFFLLGVSSLLISTRSHTRLATALAGAVLGISFLSIVGYLYDADTLYTIPHLTAVALPTALLIGLASIAILALLLEHRPARWLIDAGPVGIIARRAIPLILILPVALGWLRLLGLQRGLFDRSFSVALNALLTTGLGIWLLEWMLSVIWRFEHAARNDARQIRESENRLSLAKTSANLGIYDFDITNNCVVGDDRLREIWGALPDEMFNFQSFIATVHPDDVEPIRRLYEKVTSPQFQGRFELDYRVIPHGRDEARWLHTTGQVVFEAGRAVRMVGSVHDITELRQAEELLRENDRRKDEFLAMLAHELRNPLAPIRNSVQLLQRILPPDPSANRACRAIDRQVNHMTSLIDDLLDVARINHGKIQLRRRPVMIQSIVQNAVEMIRPFLDSKKQQLHIDVPAQEIWVDGDSVRLSQSLGNLLSNAGKFTPAQGRIDLRVQANDEQVQLIVRDNGMGIPRDKLAEVFTLFAQVESGRRRENGGLGIGLYLVQRLVQMHGGSVSVASEGINRGSEFSITLPTIQYKSATPCDDAANRIDEPIVTAGPWRVLVVDDNKDAAEMMSLYFQSLGHRVEMAHDGPSAVASASRMMPNLILLDIGLPGMDGHDACRAIRIHLPKGQATIIALTGWGRDEDRRKSVEAGFDAHLLKPVDFEKLGQFISGQQTVA